MDSCGRTLPTAIHDIDVGVDYARPLSLTRRTTLDFGTGSSVVTMPTLDLGQEAGATETQVRFVGDVGVTHEMGRTWRLRLGYNRGVGFAGGVRPAGICRRRQRVAQRVSSAAGSISA